MCGINGVIHSSLVDNQSLKEQLCSMNDLIFHRGPDEDGIYTDSSDNTSVGMAMRRLSIIDLTTGKQPMHTANNSISIVFNGEIYNYQKLKSQLEAKGVTFNTTSDTEVILKLYEQEGPSGFKKLDGMFAFSIHDKIKNKVFITRDFFGEKPLYYTKTGGSFIYASELKSLVKQLSKKPEISTTGLNLYFRLTYIPAPYTIYQDVFKLKANHYIEYDLELKSLKIEEISQLNKLDNKHISFDEAKKNVNALVRESVESRSISDVPIGTFLSGGVDSSVVSLCLSQMSDKKIDTFSIGFEKAEFDETDKSQVVAKLINSNHHEFIINEKDLEHNVDEILLNFDEPFADSSALPTYLVSNKTREFVKVALTGDGGDEVFAGYNKHYMGKLNRRYTSIVPKFAHNGIQSIASKLLKTSDDKRGKRFKINRLLKAIDYSGEFYWNIISLAFTDKEKESLFLPHMHEASIFESYKKDTGIVAPNTITDFREIDRHTSLEGDMLVKVDRTSMLNSLECRAPFLNKSIWEYTNSLPEDYLMKGWSKKHILKEAFKNEFPTDFLEKSKQGFGVPVGDWLRASLRKELESYIEPKFVTSQNIFQSNTIIPLVKNHLSGKEDNTMRVWTYYCFQKWYLNTYSVI